MENHFHKNCNRLSSTFVFFLFIWAKGKRVSFFYTSFASIVNSNVENLTNILSFFSQYHVESSRICYYGQYLIIVSQTYERTNDFSNEHMLTILVLLESLRKWERIQIPILLFSFVFKKTFKPYLMRMRSLQLILEKVPSRK